MTDAGPRKRVLGTLFAIVFTDLVGFGMIVTLLPRYGEIYGDDPITLGVFMSTYSFFQFLFAPILGRLSDRIGRRPVLLVSLAGAALGYALLGVGGSMAVLFASRVIAGACAGNISAAQAVIADTTTPENRARGMGVIGAAFGLGFIVGPAVGGVLFEQAHWAPGAAAAAASLLAFLMTFFLLPETRRVGAGGGRARVPLSLRGLTHALAHPALGVILVGFFLFVFGFANFESSFVFFCEHRFGLDAQQNGFLFLFVGTLSAVVQGALIGPLTRRFGEVRLTVAGGIGSALALLLLPLSPSVAVMTLPLSLLALGTALVSPSLSSLASKAVDEDEVGGALGVYQGLGSLARIAGPFTGVVLFKDVGMSAPFQVASGVTLVAAALAVLLFSRLPAQRASSSS